MNSVLELLSEILQPLSAQPECRTCKLCEENIGLVYLLDSEQRAVSQMHVPVVITSKGAGYIARTPKGCCAAFDSGLNACKIYHHRPLCCRLYPLDLVTIEGETWWVIHSECPIAKRFLVEHKLEVLLTLTSALENTMSRDMLEHWLQNDKMSQNIEAFCSTPPNVMRLRRLGTRTFMNRICDSDGRAL